MAEKLTWHGSKLLSRQTPRWGQDKTYPTMWRVRLLDGSGSLSDMVNRTRVKDVRRCAVEARHAVVAAAHGLAVDDAGAHAEPDQRLEAKAKTRRFKKPLLFAYHMS